MQPLAFKMLLRKKGTASAILAIALLVALITSVNCLVNNINSQTALLTKLANSGNTYLIVTETSTSLSNSQVNPDIVDQIKRLSNVKQAAFLSPVQAIINHNEKSYTVNAVGIDNLTAYFSNHHMYLNGSISQTGLQANIGVVLANLASIQKNETLNLTVNGRTSEFNVTGVVQVNEQSDSQIILPLKTLKSLNEPKYLLGYIEFSLSDANQAAATLTNISRILPSDTKIVVAQQVAAFASDINSQTVRFIDVWSVAVYAVVATASYVITARAVFEAEYELGMLGVLGAKKPLRVGLVIVYALQVVFVGSVIGVSLGVVGTQLASTVVRWVWGGSFLAPFMMLDQVLCVLLLSFAAALLGSLVPAYRAGYRIGVNPL
jgi:ABC-type lipoprotein release transport system permease subunit